MIVRSLRSACDFQRAACHIAGSRSDRSLATGFVPASTPFRSRRTNRNRRNRRGATLNKTCAQARRSAHVASGDEASGDFDPGGGTCGTDGLPLRKRGCRSYQNTFAISARNQHAFMSLSLASLLTEEARAGLCEASRCLVLMCVAASRAAGATCSASDSISFSRNESESEKSVRSDS